MTESVSIRDRLRVDFDAAIDEFHEIRLQNNRVGLLVEARSFGGSLLPSLEAEPNATSQHLPKMNEYFRINNYRILDGLVL
jgi:hypothetical protein